MFSFFQNSDRSSSEPKVDPAIVAELNQELQGWDYLYKLELAAGIVASLRDWCEKIEIVGSIRRQEPNPNDIDILLISTREYVEVKGDGGISVSKLIKENNYNKILGFVENNSDCEPVEHRNRLEAWFRGIKVDLIFSSTELWGAQKLNFTGSRQFNEMWIARANRRGYQVRNDGLIGTRRSWHSGYNRITKWDNKFNNKSEEEILEALGLEVYTDPRLRCKL